MDEIISYSSHKLSNSLTKLAPRPASLALHIWSAFQNYIGNPTPLTDQEQWQIVCLVTANAMENPALRDEIFCQVLKLLTNK